MQELTDKDRINEAFARFLSSSWSEETGERITQFFGEEIAIKARLIYDEVMGCPVDWQVATMDTALAVLADFLDAKYPWLTKVARRNLNYAYTLTWK